MGLQVGGQVGPQVLGDGVGGAPLRQDRSGAQVVQALHGRFFEQNIRSALFCGGMGLTSISNATYTTGTLTSSCTPVIGVWNPATSPVNLVILQALLGITITNVQATGGAPFVWATSLGNGAISTGTVPMNRKSLVRAGSFAKDMTNVALTGLTNNLAVCCGSSLGGGSASNAAFLATAVAMQNSQVSFIEQIDGAWIVPPGGVLALLATTTPVAHSAVSCIVWEEVPI